MRGGCRSTRARNVSAMAIAAAFAGTLAAGGAGCTRKSAAPASQAPAVAPITLSQINDRLAEDRAAGKVVVMHMWATWCGPCIEEFPHLARFYRDELANDKKVDFFAVSVDDLDAKQDVVNFVSRNGATFPVFIADAPDPNAFSRGINPAWPGLLPTTFVYGLDGKTHDIEIGEVEDLAGFKKKIEAARK